MILGENCAHVEFPGPGVVYHMKCKQCENDYIVETGRSLDIRLKQHIVKSTSAVYDYCIHTGHKSTKEH